MIDGWSSPFRFLSNWQEASFCFPDLIAVWEPIILLCVFPRISLLTDGWSEDYRWLVEPGGEQPAVFTQ